MPREAFRLRLALAMEREADFAAWPANRAMSGAEALRRAQNFGTEVAKPS